MYTNRQEKQILHNMIIEQVNFDPQFIHCMKLLIQLQQDDHIEHTLWPTNDYLHNIDHTVQNYYHAQPLSNLWDKTRGTLQTLTHYQLFCILYYLLDMQEEELSCLWKSVEQASKKGLQCTKN